MPYLPSPTFNPSISPVPVLESSSGDPAAQKDPKSVASIGKNIQAMQDQAAADRLYDAPVKEGYTNVYPSGFGKPEGYTNVNPSGSGNPWITNSQACKRVQGFTDMNSKSLSPLTAVIFAVGAVLLLGSFI